MRSAMSLTTDLPTDVATLQALLIDKNDRIERLEKLLSDFKRALFGTKSERLSSDQYELALEDLETAIAVVEAEDEHDEHAHSGPKAPRKTNRGSLPKHLPRVVEVIEPESIICECGCERHVIGEDVSERLDVVPSQFKAFSEKVDRLFWFENANYHILMAVAVFQYYVKPL